MKHLAYSVILPMAATILFSGFLAGCASTELTLPDTVTFYQPPPKQMTIEQLRNEYMADPAAANIRYDGKRIYFAQVSVVSVSKDLYPERGSNTFDAGSVTFKARYGPSLWPIASGTVVDVVGEVQGMGSYFIVKDCWIKIISGESGYTIGY